MEPLLLAGLLAAAAGPAQALGFGRSAQTSYLGQPLDFSAYIRVENDEALGRECVAAEVLAGDNRLPPQALRIAVEAGGDAGERIVRVTTLSPIEEPVVTVNLTVGCTGRMSRSFVSLIDPPGLMLAQSAPAVLQAASAPRPVDGGAAVAGPVDDTPAPKARASAVPRERTTAASRVTAGRDAALPPGTAASARPRVAAARPAPAPRLRLDPAEISTTAPLAAATPPAPDGTVLAAQAAASAAQAEAAAARERLATMEAELTRLRQEAQATQKALAQLQSSLTQAQASSGAGQPLVYALSALSALLAAAVGALWWRRHSAVPSRSQQQWWLAPTPPAAEPATAAPVAVPAAAAAAVARRAGPPSRIETQPAVMEDRPAFITESPPADAGAPRGRPNRLDDTVVLTAEDTPRRELSVEELIDLEQQADFFVVLGQDEAAVDLLLNHLRGSGGASPLPYLKLLEIYRRRGDRADYDLMRERFNARFRAYAPGWDADLRHGRALEDYGVVLTALQQLWGDPVRVTQKLDALLMREDDEGEPFDLPAYRELLFLYAIARDLAEHPAPAAEVDVDVLLPLEFEPVEAPIEELSVSRLPGFAVTRQEERAPSGHAAPLQFEAYAAAPTRPAGSEFMGLLDPRFSTDDPGRRG